MKVGISKRARRASDRIDVRWAKHGDDSKLYARALLAAIEYLSVRSAIRYGNETVVADVHGLVESLVDELQITGVDGRGFGGIVPNDVPVTDVVRPGCAVEGDVRLAGERSGFRRGPGNGRERGFRAAFRSCQGFARSSVPRGDDVVLYGAVDRVRGVPGDDGPFVEGPETLIGVPRAAVAPASEHDRPLLFHGAVAAG